MQGQLKPHRTRYWLNPTIADEAAFQANIEAVCDLYQQAPALHAQGIHVISIDEKTGMQALERIHPTQPMQPGQPERVEYEYRRHGTQALIANFEVATGKVIAPTVQDTRTETDFVAHVQQTVATDPERQWIFVADQLNTHKSATLVEWIAKACGIDVDLGVKGESGILKDMNSRAAFLQDESHRIRFVFIPPSIVHG